MFGRPHYISLLALLGCTLMALCDQNAAAATLNVSEPFIGVRHIHRVTTVPRELDMQLLEIDATASGLGFRVTNHHFGAPGETKAQTRVSTSSSSTPRLPSTAPIHIMCPAVAFFRPRPRRRFLGLAAMAPGRSGFPSSTTPNGWFVQPIAVCRSGPRASG